MKAHVLGAICLALVSQHALAVEIFKWNRVPLPIQLSVDQERIIFVDRNVSVGAPRSLSGVLRIQSVSGAVYLRATDQIPPTRLQLRDDESGEIILLDVATLPGEGAGQPLEPVRIVTEAAPGTALENEGASPPERPSSTPTPVTLTRYAAQMMYAPLRTVEPLPGVRQIPVRVAGPLTTLAPTLDIDATALNAWRLDNWTVTAVRLTNRREQPLALDPRQLQGELYSATFQHSRLGPAGTPDDTTVLYLITRDKALEQALLPAMSVAGGRDHDE